MAAIIAMLVSALAGCGSAVVVTEPATLRVTEAAPSPSVPIQSTVPPEAHLSDQKLFLVWYESEAQPLPVNQMHTWVLHILTAAGDPVEGAAVTVAGDMPEHGHGLPTQPRVTSDLGQGRYLVEGMKFSMPGYWVINFDITAGDLHDAAKIELNLE